MERLCDVRAAHLVIACGPCERRGVYRVARLRERFGDHASILDVYLSLTQTCRWQREVGSRQPNVYAAGCRARLDTSGGAVAKGLPSRT
jgi:hypothetical protein